MTNNSFIIRCLMLVGISLVFVSTANAQEVLPFPPTPSASTAGRSIGESMHQLRVEPTRLKDDAQKPL